MRISGKVDSTDVTSRAKLGPKRVKARRRRSALAKGSTAMTGV